MIQRHDLAAEIPLPTHIETRAHFFEGEHRVRLAAKDIAKRSEQCSTPGFIKIAPRCLRGPLTVSHRILISLRHSHNKSQVAGRTQPSFATCNPRPTVWFLSTPHHNRFR